MDGLAHTTIDDYRGPVRAPDAVLHIAPAVVNDTQAVKQLADRQSPRALYAGYYYAMNFLFVPDTSYVARQGNQTVGAVVGLYDFELKTLVLSHIVTALSLAASHTQDIQKALLTRAFAGAAEQGAQALSAHLDTVDDLALASMIHTVAAHYGLASHVAFNGVAAPQPTSIETPSADELRRVLASDITYRHPRADDAQAMWSLLLKINRESGGLDVYARSNYERLCRDLPQTCMIAEHAGSIVGFATGFIMPDKNNEKGLFLWQTGVHPAYAGKGIGSRVETLLIDLHNPDYLKFTVEASNGAANATALKKAKYMNATYEKPGAISSDILGNNHEAEVIYRVFRPA